MMTITRYPLLGLLGGTFDPVHHGHLAIAEHCLNQYAMQSIQFIPNQNHFHKPDVQASASDRVSMLELAIAKHPQWSINTIELFNDKPAYTIDTVALLKGSFPNHSLCFILSVEAFNGFNTWKNYLHIIDHCHLIILGRSGHLLEYHTWQQQLLSDFSVDHHRELEINPHGKILLDTYTPPAITSSEIRNQIKRNDQQAVEIDPAVKDYIKTHDLYR
ncbi:MAG: nicotinate (nicotinamide) nucleotide adenylyltransferase [Coxiellaceae bacterium]|nr:nicotinate (nicotinamide) nucleotide adenylyltransferase [Coxiellaceae bacterium]